MTAIRELIDFITLNKLKTRVNDGSDSWYDWLTIPVEGYLDFGAEPLPLSELVNIEIQTYFVMELGKRIPPKKVSVLKELIKILQTLEGIDFVCVENDDIIKVSFAQ